MSYVFEALAEVRLTTENIQKVIKMYPRDNDWKKLITKHRRDIDGLRRGKDLPKKVEDELMQWALKNGEIRSDDVDELDDFIASIMDESVNENYNQDLTLATKNVARLSNKETGQDKKDYQAVSRALAQGNLGAVKKVIKGISTKEIQADLLNILVGYNALIAKMYPKATDSKGNLKSGLTVDKLIAEDFEDINEGLPNQKELEKDIMSFMKDGRSDGITGLTGISKSLEQKYKVGPAVARSAVKKLIGDIVDGKYKG